MADVKPTKKYAIRGIYVGGGKSQEQIRLEIEQLIHDLETGLPKDSTCKKAARILRSLYGIQEKFPL